MFWYVLVWICKKWKGFIILLFLHNSLRLYIFPNHLRINDLRAWRIDSLFGGENAHLEKAVLSCCVLAVVGFEDDYKSIRRLLTCKLRILIFIYTMFRKISTYFLNYNFEFFSLNKNCTRKNTSTLILRMFQLTRSENFIKLPHFGHLNGLIFCDIFVKS